MGSVVALFVEVPGVYTELGLDCYGVDRDARTYPGMSPVVAHPPCKRWGRYWSGGPSAKVRRKLGDDDGCFAFALATVRRCGGILEHPEASHAFAYHGLVKPPKAGGWLAAGDGFGWVCCVEQGHYGHPARKATWLYFVDRCQWLRGYEPQALIWGPSKGRRLDEGFHSKQERERARAAGRKPVKRLSAKQNLATPRRFAELLVRLSVGALGLPPAVAAEAGGADA